MIHMSMHMQREKMDFELKTKAFLGGTLVTVQVIPTLSSIKQGLLSEHRLVLVKSCG